MSADPLRFSLVVPIYNEEETVTTMLEEVADVLGPHGPFEALFVDDGSRDRSLERMREFKRARGADWLRVVTLQANSGQSAAVMAGVEQSRAGIVATLDGDMQNDPRDIPSMLARVEAGEADAVVGVRAERQDTFVRRASSKVGNAVRNFLTGPYPICAQDRLRRTAGQPCVPTPTRAASRAGNPSACLRAGWRAP